MLHTTRRFVTPETVGRDSQECVVTSLATPPSEGGFSSSPSILVFSPLFSHSLVSDSATPWTAACQASLSITNSWSLPKLMSIE